jgi:hypothetical protein
MNPRAMESQTRKGARVRFRISDVFLPNQPDVLRFDPGDEEIEGQVIDFSDLGANRQFFAVIEIVQKQTVVVAIDKLKLAREPRSSGDQPPGQDGGGGRVH